MEGEPNTLELLIILAIYLSPVWLLVFTLITGKIFEKKHYANIRERERTLLGKPAVTLRTHGDEREVVAAKLATGSVVISVDHFKRFLGGFRKIFGGEMRSYSSVIDRGRREAVLRMKESMPSADLFVNTRLETATILNKQGKPMGAVEVVAYSTALKFAEK